MESLNDVPRDPLSATHPHVWLLAIIIKAHNRAVADPDISFGPSRIDISREATALSDWCEAALRRIGILEDTIRKLSAPHISELPLQWRK